MTISGGADESGAGSYISNTTPSTLITNGQGAGKIIKVAKLLIENVDTTTAVNLTLYKVASGGSISGDDWTIIKTRAIQPSDGTFGTDDIREVADLILENGDSLRALAGTASKLRFDLSTWKES